ncbi:hypothetical protein GCM10022255_049550 [Dactylosporangium darangshiense]|uniref:Uncharacterized protein n=1 Tax=Dactylosporangium darangshiense TaxID=579108 RepID=A0ABP8DCF0_9ACTN
MAATRGGILNVQQAPGGSDSVSVLELRIRRAAQFCRRCALITDGRISVEQVALLDDEDLLALCERVFSAVLRRKLEGELYKER